MKRTTKFLKPSELPDGNPATEIVWIGVEGATYEIAELKKLATDLRLSRAADLHATVQHDTDDDDAEEQDTEAAGHGSTTPMSDAGEEGSGTEGA